MLFLNLRVFVIKKKDQSRKGVSPCIASHKIHLGSVDLLGDGLCLH